MYPKNAATKAPKCPIGQFAGVQEVALGYLAAAAANTSTMVCVDPDATPPPNFICMTEPVVSPAIPVIGRHPNLT